MDAVNEREEGIKNALLSADNARKEMQNLQADNQRILQEARMERDSLLKDAREMKDKMVADAKNEAQAQGLKMIEQAKAAIEISLILPVILHEHFFHHFYSTLNPPDRHFP